MEDDIITGSEYTVIFKQILTIQDKVEQERVETLKENLKTEALSGKE